MKPLIVANWKMNPQSLIEAGKIFNSVKRGVKNIKNAKAVICPPFVYLSLLKPQESSSAMSLGGQNCFWEEKGAFTGEVSPEMLKNLGAEYVIIGHSERRKHLKETDEMLNKKLKAAIKEGLKPILCIENVSQIKKDLKEISDEERENLVLAYEPVFAIGTGKPCGAEKARKINISIRKIVRKKIPLLYGGSVNSKNAADFIEKAGFQGLLVGGASLNPKEFIEIIKNIEKV